eukprot:CAMPEP_0177278868 /NCGR_PEP_ID=MMETSP0367-20130122/69534_1 /TAXON_ID=447022 ORGANISM="Scrippsiella hangoei-like, Strain SHHI-4" /NCGR_SAMPLE_ID=MMETSP0367 /ASSEMBLY_ACC=CAM_ASM_000362 /LENGTH=357 /DNA_ID=CAMNT_0018735507 /DNA_START=8 /DNA_END=1081 /DNA_ORIENTATION=-
MGGMDVQGSAAMLAGGMGAMGMNSMMADVMANRFASELQGHAMTRWFPMLFINVQQLFSVGHSFVLRKLLVLLCPFIKRKEAPSPTSPWGNDASPGAGNAAAVGPDGLKIDTEDADLYIPCMAYVTYVLLYGVQRGMLKEFSPEILSSTFSFALVLFILEVGAFYMAFYFTCSPVPALQLLRLAAFYMAFYFTGSPVPALQLVANAGYKYFHVLLMVLFRIIIGSSSVYYVFFAYLAACSGWSVRRFMLHMEPSQLRQQYGVPASSLTKHIMTAMAVAQVPICWLLTPSRVDSAHSNTQRRRQVRLTIPLQQVLNVADTCLCRVRALNEESILLIMSGPSWHPTALLSLERSRVFVC